MNPNTERYLRNGGVSEEVLDCLRAGLPATITAKSLETWLRGSYLDGLKRRRREVEAEIGKLDRYYDQRLEKAYARLERLAGLERQNERFRGVVADIVWWFNGYRAKRGKHSHDALPDRETMLALLHALNDANEAAKTEEIPF